MASFQLFESEEADSGAERTLSAEQPVREPDIAVAAELDGQLPTEWMRNITSSLISLQASFSLFSKKQKSKKSRHHSDVAVSSAEER